MQQLFCGTQAAQRLEAATTEWPVLQQLLEPVDPPLAELLAAVRRCIHADDARILDQASARLGAVRAQRRQNLAALRQGMDQWARNLHGQGVSERPQVLHGLCCSCWFL